MPADCLLRDVSQIQPKIRQARASDIDELSMLEARIFATDRLTRRNLAALARSRSARVLVADPPHPHHRYAVVLTRRGSRSARLYSLGVEQPGRGTGSILLAAAENEALAGGALRMRLEVRPDNMAAARFYQRAGYRRFGTRPDFYEDGAAAELYERSLAKEPTSGGLPIPLSRAG
jgi:ribosomal protein S18 acetylase RimI-like enzyme